MEYAGSKRISKPPSNDTTQSRMSIPNQNYLVLMTTHQAFQELPYLISLDGTFHDHKLHLPQRRDACHHIQLKACNGPFSKRGLPLQCANDSRAKIRPHSTVILKVIRRYFFFRSLFNLCKYLLLQHFNDFRVSSTSAIQCFSAAESESVQQSPPEVNLNHPRLHGEGFTLEKALAYR